MTHLPSALSTEECHLIRSIFQVRWPNHRLAYTYPQRKCGWLLAHIVFAANGMGDAVRFLMGNFLRGSIGLVVIVGLLV
jgi:hypothetical protein